MAAKNETSGARIGGRPKALLLDAPDSGGRTTATMLASLVARLTALHLVTGATAVGSLVSGFAVLGKQVSRTASGARLRQALEHGRPGTNAAMLWKELHIHEWATLSPPSPVLDQMRNDAALLIAEDLEETMELLPIPVQRDELVEGATKDVGDARQHALDCIVGLWSYCRDLVRAVEALAATGEAAPEIQAGLPEQHPPVGDVLR